MDNQQDSVHVAERRIYLTREQENHLRILIKQMSLEQYVAFWNVVGTERLNEILVSKNLAL